MKFKTILKPVPLLASIVTILAFFGVKGHNNNNYECAETSSSSTINTRETNERSSKTIINKDDSKAPEWIKKRPIPTNNTFYYVIEKGFGKTRDLALAKAKINVNTTIAEISGVKQEVNISTVSTLDSSEGGETSIKSNTHTFGKSTNNIKKKKIDIYEKTNKNGDYVIYILYQVAHYENISPQFDIKLNYK